MAWKWKAVDGDGKPVDAAPGQPKFFCRGPETRQEMIRGAHILLNSKRRDAVTFGLPDPGYRLVESSLEYVEEDTNDLGAGPLPTLPSVAAGGAGLVPLNLPTDNAVNAAHDELIARESQG